MIICKNCLEKKEIEDYYLNTNKKIHKLCKLCFNKKYRKPYKKSLNHDLSDLIKARWRSIQSRVGKNEYKNIKNLLSKKIFFTFSINNKDLNRVYLNWIKNNRINSLKPSLDRINPRENYHIDNIRWITWSENARLGAIVLRKRKKIDQLELNGDYIQSFNSCAEAARHLKISNSVEISKCVNNKAKTAAGFKWRLSVDN